MLLRTLLLTISFVAFTSFKPSGIANVSTEKLSTIYHELQLSKFGLSENVFRLALNGWRKLALNNKVQSGIVAICDFSQSANLKRLYIIDLEQKCLLFNSLVAHGRNTGEEFAQNFSNEPSSYKSSLGFYITQNTYQGKHGLSLKLEGVEKNFNHNASDRAIVLHGADYVSEKFIKENGRLGRSLGCPSVPVELTEPIIETIKDGSCLFVYYPDKKYLTSSSLVR